MIPLDGEIREGVGLLGSPCFEIPRSVERDSRFDHLRTGDELRQRLAAKDRYNLRTMAVCLLARWLHLFLVTIFVLAAFDSYSGYAQLLMAALLALAILITPVYFVLVERPCEPSGPCNRNIAPFTTRTSGGTSAFGRYLGRRTCICSTAPRSRT